MLLKSTKILTLALITTLFTTTSGQAQGGEAAFVKGSKTIAVSLGFGVDYGYGTFYGGKYVNLPAVAVTYDQGVFENVGPGTIGIGGVVGFKNSYYRYNVDRDKNGNIINESYKDNYSNFIIGLRGTYHLTLLKDKNNKFDPYAGITVGVRIFNHKYNNPYYNNAFDNYNNVNPIAGAFIGAKYNFTKGFGAFAEVGYDISLLRIGLNFNF